MEREIITLPCGVFGPLVSDWVINVRGKSAGEGVTGAGQVVYGTQPRWEATLRLSGARRNQVLAWRSIRASMRGRINVLKVCMCDMYRPTLKAMGWVTDPVFEAQGTPHSDLSFFDDDTGYDIVPSITAISGASAGDNSIRMPISSITETIFPGNFFSVKDWPYQVTKRFVDEPGVFRFYFEPILRRDIVLGDQIRFDATALMVFQEDLEGRMPLDMGKRGETDINLIEWVDRE